MDIALYATIYLLTSGIIETIYLREVYDNSDVLKLITRLSLGVAFFVVSIMLEVQSYLEELIV